MLTGYTRAEVATLLSVSKKTVSRWVEAKILPAPSRPTRKSLRWDAAAIDRLLARKKR